MKGGRRGRRGWRRPERVAVVYHKTRAAAAYGDDARIVGVGVSGRRDLAFVSVMIDTAYHTIRIEGSELALKDIVVDEDPAGIWWWEMAFQ